MYGIFTFIHAAAQRRSTAPHLKNICPKAAAAWFQRSAPKEFSKPDCRMSRLTIPFSHRSPASGALSNANEK